MSLGTIGGFLFGIFLFVVSIWLSANGNADNILVFISIPSAVMVFGGTIANSYICYQAIYVTKALKEILNIFNAPKIDGNILVDEINKSLEWADIAAKQGPQGLEDHLTNNEPDDHLLAFGIDVVLRNYEANEIRDLMTNTIESEFQRVQVESEVLENMASNAPAFGMIGTLVGLVIMLQTMGSDPSTIGSGLAIALLTTLYGVLATRLIFQPASKKVYQRGSIERFRNYLMMEIFIMIREGRRANFIRDRIRSFLRPNMLSRIDNPREKQAEK